MMTIPSNGRVFWTGAHASIPAKWSRDTDYDGKYLQGSGTSGSNSGTATHNHTGIPHTHITESHSHSISITGASVGTTTATTGAVGIGTPAPIGHTHYTTVTEVAALTNQNATITMTATTADPIYHELILIEPDDGNQDIPDDCVVFAQRNVPTGLVICDGAGGTIDLDGKFIKIAAALGDAGGTGGADTHLHSTSSHNHTCNTHNHRDTYGGRVVQAGSLISTGSLITIANYNIHHQFTSIQSVVATNNTAIPNSDTVSSLPAYHTLFAAMNVSGSEVEPSPGVIIPFVGNYEEIANPWFYCDGTLNTPDLRAVQVRCTDSVTELGDTGGSNTHIHTATHTHTANSHDHTYSFINTGSLILDIGMTQYQTQTHTHTSNDLAVQTHVNNSSDATFNSTDIRISYRTIIFAMYKFYNTVQLNGNIQLNGNSSLAGM